MGWFHDGFYYVSSWFQCIPGKAHWKDLPHDLSGHVGPVRSLEKGAITGMMQEDHRGIRGEWLDHSYHTTSYYKLQILLIIGSQKRYLTCGKCCSVGEWTLDDMVDFKCWKFIWSGDVMWYVYICLYLYVLHPNPNDPIHPPPRSHLFHLPGEGERVKFGEASATCIKIKDNMTIQSNNTYNNTIWK